MLTLSPMTSTLGSVLDGDTGEPNLQTLSPRVGLSPSGLLTLTQLVMYVPVSWQTWPDGQQVCLFGQQTAFAYGQHPVWLAAENAAAHTVPTPGGGEEGRHFTAAADTSSVRNKWRIEGGTPAAAMIACASGGGAPGFERVVVSRELLKECTAAIPLNYLTLKTWLLIIGQFVPWLRNLAVSTKLFSTVMLWMDFVHKWSHFEPRMLLTTLWYHFE